MFTLIDAKTDFDTSALFYKILKMLQPKELPLHINAEPHPTFDMLWLMWLVGRYGESIARKSFSANVNSCLKTGGVMWECDVITLCEAEDGLTGPGPRWIGCRIKGSGILTTEPDPNPESHLQGTKGGNPSATDGEISNLGYNILFKPLFFCPYPKLVCALIIIDQLVTIKTSPSRPSPPYLFSKQSKFVVEECLRIKFIWTSFSARTHLLPFPLLQAEEGSFQ